MKLDEFKQLIHNIVTESLEEAELNEFARIANLIQPGDEAALADAKAKFKGTWVEKMIDHVVANPNGSTKIELAQAAGKPRQQDVNPVVNKLMASGAFIMGGLVTPKKEKPATTGVRGRPVQDIASLSDEEKVKRLVKQIKNYLRGVELSSGNLSPEPRPGDINWFDEFSGGQYSTLFDVVEAYINSPSVATEDAVYSFLTGLGFNVRKRGAPMKPAAPAAPAPGEDMPLEELLMMQKRAGIISEEEYRNKMENINENSFVDTIKNIFKSKAKKEQEKQKLALAAEEAAKKAESELRSKEEVAKLNALTSDIKFKELLNNYSTKVSKAWDDYESQIGSLTGDRGNAQFNTSEFDSIIRKSEEFKNLETFLNSKGINISFIKNFGTIMHKILSK